MIAYGVLKILHSRTKDVFYIFIFVKEIVLLRISLKVSGVLAAQVGMKLVSKLVLVWLYLGRKALKFINNHPKL